MRRGITSRVSGLSRKRTAWALLRSMRLMTSSHRRARLIRKLLELGDAHFPIRENGSDLQFTPERFNVSGQRAQINVGAVLDFGYFALFHSEGFRQTGLGHAAGFAQFLEGHCGQGLLDAAG